MAKVVGHRLSVRWGNPYTQPPDGKEPTQLVMEVRKPHPIPPEITAKLEELGPLGSGWSLYS